MDPEVRKVIEDAYELLKDPDHFVTNREAVTDAYSFVECNSPAAVRWCAIGAVAKVMDCRSFSFTGQVGYDAVGLLSKKAVEVFPDFIRQLHVTPPLGWGPFPDSVAELPMAYIVQVNNVLGHEALMQVFEKVLAEDGGLPV